MTPLIASVALAWACAPQAFASSAFETTPSAALSEAAPPTTTVPATITPSPGETTPTVTPWSARSIGRSVRGRPIRAYRFGAGKRRLLVIGGVHGNEWGDNVALALVRALKARPSLVPSGTEVHVIAVLNPDGVARNTRGNARRVDLNRNLPTGNWRTQLSRRDPSRRAGLTGGTRSGSEPETAALLRYASPKRFAAVVALHSRGGFISPSGPGSRTLAARIGKPSGLPLGHVGYDSVITGSMGRYFSVNQRIPIVTIELKSPTMSSGLRDGIARCLR
ncbi:MAG: DUF2817 domain-containing protein [Coriobacteriia bacterium]|nr:DUF2817 domain-containing protein [Coriobacteriia bacterium]